MNESNKRADIRPILNQLARDGLRAYRSGATHAAKDYLLRAAQLALEAQWPEQAVAFYVTIRHHLPELFDEGDAQILRQLLDDPRSGG